MQQHGNWHKTGDSTGCAPTGSQHWQQEGGWIGVGAVTLSTRILQGPGCVVPDAKLCMHDGV